VTNTGGYGVNRTEVEMNDLPKCGICGATKQDMNGLMLCPNCAMLRFAPVARVSTEQQERQGESLRVQKEQLMAAVKTLRGRLIDDPWRYSGQAHATPEFEHERLEQLMRDTPKDIFDAVIVTKLDRWSRDARFTINAWPIFFDNGIKFYEGMREINFNSPMDVNYFEMGAVQGGHFARIMALASAEARISRAKRGIPTCGKKPYARRWDKHRQEWVIDEEAHNKIKYAASEFLSGRAMQDIADELGMNNSNLQLVLKKKCGTDWPIRFRSKRFNIDETVMLQIPRLLDEETIQAVKDRLASNRTVRRAPKKYKYLLKSVIFCSECGYTLSGDTKPTGNFPQNYVHPRGRKRVHQCKHFTSIPCEAIDGPVLLHLFTLMGNEAAIGRAIKQAIPNRAELKVQASRLKDLEAELKQVDRHTENLLDEIEKGNIRGEVVKKRMEKLETRQKTIMDNIERIKTKTKDLPTKEVIELRASMLKAQMSQLYSEPNDFKNMTFEDKRELILKFFEGVDADGKRLGVYLTKTEDGFRYEIKGMFGQFAGPVYPGGLKGMEAHQIAKEFNTSMDYADNLKAVIDEGGFNMLGKCHAHHRQCIYQ